MKKRHVLLSVLSLLAMATTACEFTLGGGGSNNESTKSESSVINPTSQSESKSNAETSTSASTVSSNSNSSVSSSSKPSSATSMNSSTTSQPVGSSTSAPTSTSSVPSTSSTSSVPTSSSATSSSSTSSSTTSSTTSIPSSSSSSSTSSSTSGHETPQEVSFDIYAFNDIHGNVKDTEGKGLGIAKTTTLLKELSQDKNTIFISQGDMWQGSVESNLTEGHLVTEWMNQMDFVSMTVGNHEYDWGSRAIVENSELANFPTLGINVVYNNTNTRVDYLDASTTFEKEGVKFGVIGAIGNCLSSISSSQVQGVHFLTGEDLSNVVKAESTRLRNEENCDFIIYSIHGSGSRDSDDWYDDTLSSGNYVDLVLEGHTHDGYAEQDDYGVYHVQCYGYNQCFYQITVDIDLVNNRYDVRTPVEFNTRYYDSPYRGYAEDAGVLALFEKYKDQYEYAYEYLGINDTWKDAGTLRQTVANLYLAAGMEKWGAQYDLVLGGGYISCRGSGLHAGNVIYADVLELFPFNNDVVLCSVQGRYFKNTQYVTGSSNYFCDWTSYGNDVRNNIDDNATYYLVTDTYNSDYAANHLTIIDRLQAGGRYARDLLAEYIKAGHWHIETTEHAGTLSDPKTIAEAVQLAGQYNTQIASTPYYFVGVVSYVTGRFHDASGDLYNLRVYDTEQNVDILIYRLAKTEGGNPNWVTAYDLEVGDRIVFWGAPFTYTYSNGNTVQEFGVGTYCVSINGNPTA